MVHVAGKMVVSPDQIRELLDYDPSTGACRWKDHPLRTDRIGSEAGYLTKSLKQPRWRISIAGKDELRSRVAWCIMTGHWPTFEIDHINRDYSDDRWINLRELTRSNGNRNRQIPKRIHYNLPQGIHPSRNKTGWIARWHVDGKRTESKTFYSIEEAVQFRETKLKSLGLHEYSPKGD